MYRFKQTCSPFKNAFKLTKCYRAFFLIQVEFIGYREMIIEQQNHRDSKPGACELNVLCFHTNFVFLYTFFIGGTAISLKQELSVLFGQNGALQKFIYISFIRKYKKKMGTSENLVLQLLKN